MLHAGRTDLATARCLADQGIPVYATIVSDADIARYSNSLSIIDLRRIADDDEAIA
ncbi:hypothetical protein [endosymbiont of Riftia pachyptila]|uniref:hypothetical protein n=1 Tax=endosymbiont of Riftia pachyptila TaxID=54396 RepID=UPI0002F208B7|nr:hypothetical protein [endosymbiont of Riftia pachyptila]